MAVSKRLRYEILRRDSHTCRYCGTSAPDVPLRVDHVTPVALGGTDEPSNLATSCEPCNSGKSSSTVDAATVADVSDDALRWAAAMQQAADEKRQEVAPKLAYREHFKKSWQGWTREVGWKTQKVELPDSWKGSLDTFYEAGLPQEVWPDIVEKAMTNPTVRVDNTFRYACGIAWRMVRELQERAKTITGVASKTATPADSLTQAAIDIWENEQAEDVTSEMRKEVLASLAEVCGTEDPHRVLFGAQLAAWCGETDVAGALRANDHSEIYHQWWCSWLSTVGDYPPDEAGTRMRKQIDTLLADSVSTVRIARAAVYAGARKSVSLHFGLDANEQELIGVTGYFWTALEAWCEAFHAVDGRWPDKSERSAFIDSIGRIAADGDIYIADIQTAASAAGAYQDPDISTCLPRHGSVFEILSQPVGGVA
ncbi:HNH endonuclease [Streptomyces sp. NPDC020747]|uniref:HNH endonuclease n=1 Tax=Streptomyces sp. NPDC020747 TaxID=3365086 RepID=UPI0037B8DF4C